MIDATTTLEAGLDYAERMVRKGFSTPEQAAQVCGVHLSDLKARLALEPQSYAPVREHHS